MPTARALLEKVTTRQHLEKERKREREKERKRKRKRGRANIETGARKEEVTRRESGGKGAEISTKRSSKREEEEERQGKKEGKTSERKRKRGRSLERMGRCFSSS